ncbi:MAG: hypothetical protein KAH31_05010 [Candidatus Sabulitectum sp.]|nr:hypothetical protein [Candidatus Sabulitectum sp.]
MKYSALILLLMIGISTGFSSDIFAVLPVSGEGHYFVSYQNTSDNETAIGIGLLSPEGELLWERESGTVRGDATDVSACPCFDGGFLTALAFGIGYTDILITKWSTTGEVIASDTISFFCYDSPQNLFQFQDGYVLMWDSWSSQRGVHLARLDQNGSVIETVFAVETLHPAGTALAVEENSFAVAVSPIVAIENPQLTGYGSVDNVLWSHFLPEKDHEYGDFVVDLSYAPSGELVALWRTMATGEQPASYCVTEHSRNGDMLEYYSFPMEEFSDISFAGLQAGTDIVLMGHSPEESAFWIAFTDLQGELIEKLSVNLKFIPTGIQFLNDHSFLVTGVEEGSDQTTLLHVSAAGEVLWAFPEREL